MTDPQFRSEKCQETAGFLFSHPCGEMAAYECAQCHKLICQRHAIDDGGTVKCVACKKAGQPQAATDPGSSGGEYHHSYPPYFYGQYYGYGYAYDQQQRGWHAGDPNHHFVDSDEAALSGGEPSAEGLSEFEERTGAS